MKKVVIVFLVVMLILSFRGCDLFKGPEMGSDIKAEMLKYLEDKYDEEFEVEYISFGDWLHPRTEMGAYPKDGDSQTDWFTVVRDKVDGKVIIEDGYYRIFIREEYEEYVRDIVTKYFPGCKFYIEIMAATLDSALTKEVSLVEAMKIQVLPLGVRIFTVADDELEYKATFEDFCMILSDLVPDATAILIGLEENDFTDLCYQNSQDDIYNINENRYSRVNFYIRKTWIYDEVIE